MTKPAQRGKMQTDTRKLKHALVTLTKEVATFLLILDREMRGPSTVERGKRIAAISNSLEMVNDKIRFFTLNEDWRKIKGAKP